ncbi:hypothetical protein NDU88_001361 [Pleurodeles waltl]|uniref:Uncharacterized protein n=1 Tax=Pleurodeles waltl TaxID=8319 RepID=A0AAV7LCX8_PLEWA|nr:hypothetical protein NDU88_001361 [Pleurodeles waltl]
MSTPPLPVAGRAAAAGTAHIAHPAPTRSRQPSHVPATGTDEEEGRGATKTGEMQQIYSHRLALRATMPGVASPSPQQDTTMELLLQEVTVVNRDLKGVDSKISDLTMGPNLS